MNKELLNKGYSCLILEGYAKRCADFPTDLHVLPVGRTFYGKDVHEYASTSRKIESPMKVLMQKDLRSSRSMYIFMSRGQDFSPSYESCNATKARQSLTRGQFYRE